MVRKTLTGLVAKIFEETADHMMEHMKPFHKDADQMDLEHPPEIWVQVFEHVAEQSQLYLAMLGKNGSPWFVARMREYIIKLILENEKRWKPSAGSGQQVDPAMPEALPVMQLSHVLIGTIVWWLESEKSYTPRQIATWFCHFAFYGYLSTRGYEVPLPGKDRKLRHIDANYRHVLAIGPHLSVGSTSFLHSLKIGEFLSQSVFRAKLLVRKINIDSSIQAQGTGDFMRRNWLCSIHLPCGWARSSNTRPSGSVRSPAGKQPRKTGNRITHGGATTFLATGM